jgi:CBS domain-containing protein
LGAPIFLALSLSLTLKLNAFFLCLCFSLFILFLLILITTIAATATGNMTGVVSERDYICKIALLGKTSKETPIREISTSGANIITALAHESVDSCMEKMMSKGVRHLPIVDDKKKVIGMVSIKDLVKTVVA